MMADAGAVMALSGGTGGAKLVAGLARLLPPQQLTVVANTGDDMEHLGLTICPDLDTQLYTLAGISSRTKGWGLEGETWQFMSALKALGGTDWFQLGDRDLATHVWRSWRLSQGASLSRVTEELCRALGVRQRLLPMSDQPVRTIVRTEQGSLSFQEYFVRQGCRSRTTGFDFMGLDQAQPHPDFIALLRHPGLAAVVLCPSNPFVSIGPILALPGVREALQSCRAPVVGVSPIITGKALKGPAAQMMESSGLPVSAGAVAGLYDDFLDGWVVDTGDSAELAQIQIPAIAVPTIMKDESDRLALSREVIDFAAQLARQGHQRRC